MEIFKITELTFSYPATERDVLKNISFNVQPGEFVTICGKSGCGKTTLLRLLKTATAPAGNTSGEILFKGKSIDETDAAVQASAIGFVMQDPESQICTDKVWHEMAFGLESLGCSNREIRTRVSEMASFFGIQNLFHENTAELSGGQKQILNLASVMVLNPDVLILDEPSGQLDPIAASEFFTALKKIHEELGTTIILSEHRLEEVLGISDRVIVMDEGEIISDSEPRMTGGILKKRGHEMFLSMPAPMRAFEIVDGEGACPLNVKEGSRWLEELSKRIKLNSDEIPGDCDSNENEIVIDVKNAYFRYKKEQQDVIKDFSLQLRKGEFLAVLGGNGTGKTTALSLISGLNRPHRGEIHVKGKKISSHKDLYGGLMGVLPQNPKSIFAHKTVYLDMMDMTDKNESSELREKKILEIAELCRIEKLLNSHPYDLSGGEQQRAALAMILMKKPEIILMDEPTKGMDGEFKRIFSAVLKDLIAGGTTILMVSHDIEFCAENAHRCALFFDGAITSMGTTREFFKGNRFYTTSINRMARRILPEAVIVEDIVLAAGMKNDGGYNSEIRREFSPGERESLDVPIGVSARSVENNAPKKRMTQGIVCGMLCIAAIFMNRSGVFSFYGSSIFMQGLAIIFAGLSISGFIPQKEISISRISGNPEAKSGRTRILTALAVFMAVPFTIYCGIHFLDDRKYYFISFLIILEIIIPFCMMYEKRKPQAREIVLISTLCALAVAGRAAFFMLPEFKPMMAIVIIAGICFGGETGFLVGAVSALVSNFIFGQGPWTPWQMFAFGAAGYLTGVLIKSGLLRKTKLSITVFGFFITFVFYGVIMNMASVFMIGGYPTAGMIKMYLIAGIPMDFIHGLATVFFLWFIAEPMIEKLERIKLKYGLI